MLFCQAQDKVTVDYALSIPQEPMGVSEYKLKIIESLTQELKGHLPSAQEQGAELAKGVLEKTAK